ncbi:MAG: DNA-processing protein DprA [Actinomycetota bacterium]|nr:DNA-processing protein DprA [Actinomycetota bacterium]
MAYLGIGLRPELWRHCRHVDNEGAVSLYTRPLWGVAATLGVDRATAGTIRKTLTAVDLKAECERLRQLETTFLTPADPAYPAALRAIYDPPAAVFIKGALDCSGPVVAIVGARRCTAYGKAVAEEMAMDLAKAGITVVSGMARGIDSAAHIGALRAGRTIAVLGSGLDILYPPENRVLAARIIESGALISEFPPGTPPRPLNFPARNRIISGLAAAVVVVEASKRSGALITADFALEQGKEVLVVPGSVRSPVSAGCHELLKQGAGLAASAEDILEAIGLEMPAQKASIANNPAVETAILGLVDYSETHVDDILVRAGRPAHEVLGDLSLLEVNGLISRQAGGWYTRLK